MVRLSSELYQHCRETLLKCSEFDSNSSLRTLFVTSELQPFRSRLPEATSKSERIDACLDFLLSKHLRNGQPVLPVFLVALCAKYSPDDALHDELKVLTEAIRAALISGVTSISARPLDTATRRKLPATPVCIALNRQGQPCSSRNLEPSDQLCPEHLKMVLEGKVVKDHEGKPISQDIAILQKRRQQRRKIRWLLFGWYPNLSGLTRTLIILVLLVILVVIGYSVANWLPVQQSISQESTVTSFPGPTPSIDLPVDPGEIVIVIARFQGAEGYGIQHRISRTIRDELDAANISNVQIIDQIEDTVSPEQEDAEQVVQKLGDTYNATAVIWGWMDKAGFTPNFTITSIPDMFFPKPHLQEVPTLPEKSFQTYIQKDLPAQMAYFTAWTIAQIYFWNNQIEQASSMLDRALEEAERGNTTHGLEHIYLYRGLIETEFHHNLEQAIIEYSYGIDINSGLGALYNSRGIAYAHLGRYLEAIADYDRAIDIYKGIDDINNYASYVNFINHAYAYNNRCMAYMYLEDFDQALEDCNKAIELQRDTSDISHPLTNRGWIYWRLDDFDAALADFEAAVEYDPQNVESYIWIGRLYERSGDLRQALSWYQQAISVDPRFSEAHYELGKIYEERGDDQAALQEYEKAIFGNSEDDYYIVNAYRARGNLYEQLGQDDKALGDYVQVLLLEQDDYELFNLCQHLNRCSEIVNQLQDLATQSNNPGPVHIALGHLYDRLEEFEKAIREFSIALELKTTPDVYNARASVYLKIPNAQAAMDDYTKAIILSPGNRDAYVGRAQSYQQLNRFNDALADFLQLTKITPRDDYIYDQLYELCEKMGVCEKILKDLAAEVTTTYFDPNIYLILAQLNQEMDNNEKAIDHYNNFLELDQDDTWVYEKRAELFEQVNRLDKAIADYSFILQHKPQAIDIYNARAAMYERQGEYQLALADYNQAAQVDPTNRTTLSARAVLYEKLNNVSLGTIDHVTIVSTSTYIDNYDVDQLVKYCQKYNTCYQAITELSTIISKETSPKASAYYARGRLYEETNQLAKALIDYDNATMRVGNEEELFIARARVHMQLSNYAKAVADYSQVLEIASSNIQETYMSRAVAYEKLGNKEQALEDYKSAILTGPYLVDSMDSIIRLCNELNTCPEILTHLQRAAEDNPEHKSVHIAIGVLSSHLNDDETALAAFDVAIKLGDNSREVYAGRAEIYAKRGQYLQATNDYVQALSSEWIYSPLVKVLVQTCQAGNTCQEAINLLNKWITNQADKDTVMKSFYFQSLIYAALKDAEQESQAYVNLLSGYTTHPWYTSELIRRCKETNSCQLTINQLTKAIVSNSVEYPMLYYTRGRLYSELGDSKAAVADLSAAIELDSAISGIYELRAETYNNLQMPQEAIKDYAQAILYASDASWLTHKTVEVCQEFDLYEFAIETFGATITTSPENGWLHYARGRLHVEQRDLSLAMDDFNQAIDIDPDQSTWLKARAEVYERLGKNTAALEDYLQVISLSNSSIFGHGDLIQFCQKTDLCEEAVAKLASAIQEQPGNLQFVLARAEVYLAQNNNDAALEDYNRAVALAPLDVNVYQLRAKARERVGDSTGALVDYIKTVSLDGSNISIANDIVRLCQHVDNCESVIEQLSNFLEISEAKASLFLNRGIVYEVLGDNENAITDLSNAIEADDTNVSRAAYFRRAALYEHQENFDRAIEDYTSLIENYSDNEAYYYRGLAYKELGKTDLALQDLQAYLKANPSTSRRSEVEEEIENLVQ